MKEGLMIAEIPEVNLEVNLVMNLEEENCLHLDQKTHVMSIENENVIEVLISDLL